MECNQMHLLHLWTNIYIFCISVCSKTLFFYIRLQLLALNMLVIQNSFELPVPLSNYHFANPGKNKPFWFLQKINSSNSHSHVSKSHLSVQIWCVTLYSSLFIACALGQNEKQATAVNQTNIKLKEIQVTDLLFGLLNVGAEYAKWCHCDERSYSSSDCWYPSPNRVHTPPDTDSPLW